MKVKVSEASGTTLDALVAIAKGIPVEELYPYCRSLFRRTRDEDGKLDGRYMTGPDLLFSRKWEAGGPILGLLCETGVSIRKRGKTFVLSDVFGVDHKEHFGQTPLIAACRCYVTSKLGEEVELPEALCS